jgi:hypothetical protein
MYYEIRTYDVEPFTMGEVMKRFNEALQNREVPGGPVGVWATDIGPLSQFIHLWVWDSLDQREAERAAAYKDPAWPPKISEFLTGPMTSEIFVPYGFSPELKPGKYGPFYEMRSYILRVGEIPKIAENWPKALDKRTKYSALLTAMHSEIGGLNKFVHIWPYDSLDTRHEVRAKSVADGAWPAPGAAGSIVRMESKIMLPAPFSPLQ